MERDRVVQAANATFFDSIGGAAQEGLMRPCGKLAGDRACGIHRESIAANASPFAMPGPCLSREQIEASKGVLHAIFEGSS